MKMAKASEADLQMAMELCQALDALTGRWGATMPEKIAQPKGTSDNEYFDADNSEQCRRVVAYLRELAGGASLMRVVWGMAVVCDPANKLLDPAADTLEHHPAANARIGELTTALQMLYDETADYIRLNNLGGMENQCMKLARAALGMPTP